MVNEITVIKVPRTDDILDQPINFPPLQNLHLDMMEIKKKLKKGLPAITVRKKAVSPPVVVQPKEIIIDTKPSKAKPKSISIDLNEEEEEFNEEDEEEFNEEDEPEFDGDADDADMIKELGGREDQTNGADSNGFNNHDSGDQIVTVEEPDPNEGKSQEQIDEEEKQEYIWRFKILKKQYKDRDIPVFNEYDDVPHMKSVYNSTIKEIQLERNVDSYKTYLVGSFFVMEFVFTNFVGADITGFSKQQMLIMDKYEVLLIELGERSYNSWGSNLPIELRLVGMVFMQAGIFYMGKIIADKAGGNIGMIFQGMSGQPVTPAGRIPGHPTTNGSGSNGGTPGQPEGRKMRGPSIKVSDIKRDST